MEINCADMGEVLQRGRLYERYREKREAKLREEWFLKMEGKEAEMRAMWDRIDIAKPPSSCQDSRLSDAHSDLCPGQEQITKSIQSEKKTKATVSRTTSMKRSDVDRTTFSVAPLTTKENRAPIPADRPNTSSSMSSQRSLSRSRTVTGEQKKGQPVKSHHRRNTLAGPAEFKGLELDNSYYMDSSSQRKNHVGKSFLRKGSGIGPGAGAAIAKQRSSGTCSGSESADSYSNEELKEAQNVVRERKKWGIPEKPMMFSGDQSQKTGTRGLKKLLLNIVGKTKTRESSVICA